MIPSRAGRSQQPRIVWFHREYVRLQGGHLVHAHYFADVARMPGFQPRIVFTPVASAPPEAEREVDELWPTDVGERVSEWSPSDDDVLFLAGIDWRYLLARKLDELPCPRLNLLQHVRHADAGSELRGYLALKAIRICVSEEVADSVIATGEVNGPVHVIPNGCDLSNLQPDQAKTTPLLIVGYKAPDLARDVSAALSSQGVTHELLVEHAPREQFLAMLEQSVIAVTLPRAREGFFLPAIEAMALGCLVVTTDCVGNRSFCHHEENCLIAEQSVEGLTNMILRAAHLSNAEQDSLRQQGLATADAHSLSAQRAAFHELLGSIDQLW